MAGSGGLLSSGGSLHSLLTPQETQLLLGFFSPSPTLTAQGFGSHRGILTGWPGAGDWTALRAGRVEAWAQQCISQPISSLPSRWIRLQAQDHPMLLPFSSSFSSIHWSD